MSDPVPRSCDVAVIGAGLAGLACATDLLAAGLDVQLLEADERVGGRMATDRRDGFVLDRGFQVLNTSYPQVRSRLDLAALDVRTLTPGALVRRGQHLRRVGNPLRAPRTAPASLGSGLLSVGQWARLGAFSADVGLLPAGRIKRGADTTARDMFADVGLHDDTVERLLRPFLSGVLLESELSSSARFAKLVWRSFVRGNSVLPAEGIGAVPARLAALLPADRIRTGTEVSRVTPGRVDHSSGTLRCRALVVATDPVTAGDLLPGLTVAPMVGVTTSYFATADPPLAESVIVLDGDGGGPVVNTEVLSAALPSYAPPGTALISASVLGAPRPEDEVRAHLQRLYGVSTGGWESVAVVRVPRALPRQPAGAPLRREVSLGDGVFVAGDHRDTPSTQGALASGTRAARAVRRHLRGDRRAALSSFVHDPA